MIFHLLSAVGSLKVDKLHTKPFDISTGPYISQFKQLKKNKKDFHKIKYFYLSELRLSID